MVRRRHAFLPAYVLALLAGGCVEPFGGSTMQVTFAGGVEGPGLPAEGGRPPPGTHFSFYGVITEGEPSTSFAFHVADFEIQPVIATTSPCFIENDESRFPGLHSTKYLQKLREVTGISEGEELTDSSLPRTDVIDVLTARERMVNMGRLQAAIQAVTSFSPALPPEADQECGGSGIPPADCLNEADNLRRLERCRAFWAANPTYYQGNDEVFTLPHNGRWLGAVTTTDPRNNAFVGGAGFYSPVVFDDRLDALLVNWQYDDVDGDGEPDYPDELPAEERSPIGFHFMSGAPVDKTRGVINVPMINRVFTTISGEAAIYTDLDSDNVTF